MGDILDFMAWSAAEDAASASRNAEEAAHNARIKTERLIDIQTKKENDTKVQSLNKMLQDLFYGREVEYYNLKDIRGFVNRKDSQFNKHQFPQKTSFPRFPVKSSIFLAVSSYLAILNYNLFFTFVMIVVALFSLLVTLADIKQWNYWKKNKNAYEEQRLKNIKNTYEKVVASLKEDYPMLSLYGMMRKQVIDMDIKDTYEVLKALDRQKAEEALIEFYNLILEINVTNEVHKRKIVKMFYEQSEDVRKLAKNFMLFTYESLAMYNDSKK